MEHPVRINLLDGHSETTQSKSSTTTTPSTTFTDRSSKFSFSGYQLENSITSQKHSPYLSSEFPSLSDTIVKICKHCAHSFHSLSAEDNPGNLYCSKDCRVCHTWFKSSSICAQPVIAISRSSSPNPQKYASALRSTSNFIPRVNYLNDHSNNRKMRDHYSDIHKREDGRDSPNSTWRVCNPGGEKKIIPTIYMKKDRKNASISPSSVVAGSATCSDSVIVQRPLQRVLSFFY